jgi:hypothetical protein
MGGETYFVSNNEASFLNQQQTPLQLANHNISHSNANLLSSAKQQPHC